MKTEILIQGCGLAGMISALSLAAYKIPSVIIDENDLSKEIFDLRSIALNKNSIEFLASLGVGLEELACPIEDIYVLNNGKKDCLHFENGSSPIGYIIANTAFRKILFEKIKENPFIKLIDNFKIKNAILHETHTIIEGSNATIHADLSIISDKKSLMRRDYFTDLISKDYEQFALTFNVSHEIHHHNQAIERFFSDGPFAILPLKDGYTSSIVWTLPKEKAILLSKASELNAFMQERFGKFLGEVNIISKIDIYPLQAKIVKSYYNKKMVLIADAAHVIHPLAGQGLNMGIKDIKALTKLIKNYKEVGLTVNQIMLSDYQKLRYIDNILMFLITDHLSKLFSNSNPILDIFRSKGLSLVDKLPLLNVSGFFQDMYIEPKFNIQNLGEYFKEGTLKEHCMKYAMGLSSYP